MTNTFLHFFAGKSPIHTAMNKVNLDCKCRKQRAANSRACELSYQIGHDPDGARPRRIVTSRALSNSSSDVP